MRNVIFFVIHFLEVSIIQSYCFFDLIFFFFLKLCTQVHTSSNHKTMLEQHSESDWQKKGPQVNSAFGLFQEGNSHILKDVHNSIYIVKISSLSQKI